MSDSNSLASPAPSETPFERIRQSDEDGAEFWSARDLMLVLEYDSCSYYVQRTLKLSAKPTEWTQVERKSTLQITHERPLCTSGAHNMNKSQFYGVQIKPSSTCRAGRLQHRSITRKLSRVGQGKLVRMTASITGKPS